MTGINFEISLHPGLFPFLVPSLQPQTSEIKGITVLKDQVINNNTSRKDSEEPNMGSSQKSVFRSFVLRCSLPVLQTMYYRGTFISKSREARVSVRARWGVKESPLVVEEHPCEVKQWITRWSALKKLQELGYS